MAKSEIRYNDAILEIDEILDQIENDNLNIDDLSDKVKRVSFLLKTCKKKLVKTEAEIQKVIDDIDLD